MALPRLLFVNEKTSPSTDPSVITDLKLDLVLPKDVTDVLILAPDRDAILKRREAFSLLLADPEAEKRLCELLSDMSEAEELYRAMTAALSENTAAYVFAHLVVKLGALCRSAEKMKGYGFLFERFSGVFSELSGKAEFKEACEKAEALCIRLKECASVVIRTDGESAVISSGENEGMAAALRRCAEELDVPITERAVTKITLQRAIADACGRVYPEVFAEAVELLGNYRSTVTGEIFDYLPELKFVSETVKFTKRAALAGLPYCFPELSDERCIDLKNVYDITLLKKEGTVIVPNDVSFSEAEPFFYLTGANGGGKTTYIRTVGGAMLMFLAGAPVFCEGGRASVLSAVYAHFPRDERFEGTGRFLDEKNRVDAILAAQDGNALVLLNETFATTGEEKAVTETDILAKTLLRSGNFGLYITHQHDVAEAEIPFLGVTVDELDSNRRTYKIEKRRLPPRSFAKDILGKYGLDRETLMKRFSER